jgi:ribosomal protein S18 acetylase RimI-like enzyme
MQAFSIEVGAPLSETHISNALRPLLQNPLIGEVWVAHDKGIVGYLVMSWGWGIESGGGEALIDEVYVTPEARGSMVATGLVQAALDSAQIRGTRAIFLETEADNPRSRKLYERLGFEVEPSMWMRRKI